MRYIVPFLQKDLKKHLVLLSGPRQCGKTTLAKSLLREITTGQEVYLNWDQVKDRKKILSQEWSDRSSLVVLDEIHKKRGWKTFLKGIYDTKPSPISFLITGSARLEMFQKAGDSMFGRYRSWRLHPFCLAEDPLELSVDKRFDRLLTRGGFPFPYLVEDPDEVQRWRNQRWSALLREDVRDLESIKDIQKFELLAELLKKFAANMLSFANLAQDVEIAPKTAKAWVSILERLYLITLISPYTGSLKRALSKTPKVYFTDPGDLLESERGVRVENLVATQLLKRVHFIEDAFGDRVGLHYVRDKEGREIDFLITKNKKPLVLIEVKNSPQDFVPALSYFKKKLDVPYAIQLHADTAKPFYSKNGMSSISIQDFFSNPVTSREFWKR